MNNVILRYIKKKHINMQQKIMREVKTSIN